MSDIVVDSVARIPAEALTPVDTCRIERDLTFKTYFKKDYGFGDKEPVCLFDEREDGSMEVPRLYDLSAWTGTGRASVVERPSAGVSVSFSFDEAAQSEEISKKHFQDGLISQFLSELDYQSGAFKGGILSAPCGSGKTAMAIKIAHIMGLSTLVLVNKEFLQRQWVGEFLKFTDLTKDDIGLVKQKKCQFEGKKVVIASIQSVISREYPPEFYAWPGVLVVDECVAGDTLVETNSGKIPIKDFPLHDSISVLSFDVSRSRWSFRPVTGWFPKGRRRVLRVSFVGGSLLCTPEHLCYTQRGWVEASALQRGDRILNSSSALVGAGSCCGDSTTVGVPESSSLGTLPRLPTLGSRLTATLVSSSGCVTPLSARAVVGSVLGFPSSVRRVAGGVIRATRAICRGTTVERRCVASSRRRSGLLSWGRFWGIRPLRLRMQGARRPVSASTTGRGRKRGHVTRLPSCLAWVSGLSFFQIPVTALLACAERLRQLRRSWSLTPLPTAMVQSASVPSGSTGLAPWASRGGLWTTVPRTGKALRFTPRGIRKTSAASSSSGSDNKASVPTSMPTEVIGLCGSTTARTLPRSLNHTSFQKCATSWSTIESVEDHGEVDVYDIEVADNHNFIANGVLVHNCHRLAAPQWSKASTMFPAAYRIGVSATPRRKDGLGKVLDMTVGPVLAKGTRYGLMPFVYQFLRHTYINPDLYYRPETATRAERTLLARYLRFLVAKEPRNAWLVKEMVRACGSGRKIFILSDRRNHLEVLKRMFDKACGGVYSSGFYMGGMKQADLAISAAADAIFGTFSMASEGLNIPAMDTLFLTTPHSDVEQPTGRILRNHDGKKTPVVVDVVDDAPFCMGWGEKRLKQYERLGYDVRQAPDYAAHKGAD